jgi:hypothetical protein
MWNLLGGRPRPTGEDDLRWTIPGIEYLLKADAEAPAKKRRLQSLRRRMLERIREAAAWSQRLNAAG